MMNAAATEAMNATSGARISASTMNDHAERHAGGQHASSPMSDLRRFDPWYEGEGLNLHDVLSEPVQRDSRLVARRRTSCGCDDGAPRSGRSRNHTMSPINASGASTNVARSFAPAPDA